MARIGFYPGSFDPVTYGHLDIITRAAQLFDELVLAIGAHHEKTALLPVRTRIAVLKEVILPITEHTDCQISFAKFSCLAVDAARRAGAQTIVRGLRDGGDFDYEVRMAQMNAAMAHEIDTIFLAASPSSRMISSSLVKQIAALGGDIGQFVPMEAAKAVKAALAEKDTD